MGEVEYAFPRARPPLYMCGKPIFGEKLNTATATYSPTIICMYVLYCVCVLKFRVYFVVCTRCSHHPQHSSQLNSRTFNAYERANIFIYCVVCVCVCGWVGYSE